MNFRTTFDRFDEHERITLHFLKQGLVGLSGRSLARDSRLSQTLSSL